MDEVSYHARAKAVELLPVSDEILAMARETQSAIQRWMTATPEELDEWARAAEQERREKRAAAGPPVELTLDALLDKLGFSHEYAEHLVQPYCDCGDGMDGWERCQHARDLGLTR